MRTFFNFKETNYNPDKYLDLIKEEIKDYKFNTFNLGISIPSEKTIEEKEDIKLNFQKQLTSLIEEKLNIKKRNEYGDVNIVVDFNYNRIDYNITPVYVYGIYNKLQRNLPQTIDYCFKCKGKGCKLCDYKGVINKTSIQEKINSYFKEIFKNEDNKFHGSGREDKDVLMLGNGREFILELINPKLREISLEELNKLLDKINLEEKDVLQISNLSFCEKSKIKEIKEAKHFKSYRAIVSCEEKILQDKLNTLEKNKIIEIIQKNPKRMKKSRANIERKRTCEIINYNIINENEFELELKAEAGLYVKEFISGDNELTKPSISEIIENKCICKQLDVIYIHR